MDKALVDTDILSEVLKRKDRRVLAKARKYLGQHQRFSFSEITAYEIIRGLKAGKATRQLSGFLNTLATSDLYPVNIHVLLRAADLWTMAHTGGYPKDDVDLIIAATALHHGLALVTGNTAHFSWIPGLTLEDWRQP